MKASSQLVPNQVARALIVNIYYQVTRNIHYQVARL